MKKLSLIAIIILFGLTVTLAGCSANYVFTEKKQEYNTEEIEKIALNVIDRTINVSASSDDKIHIEYYDNNKEYLDIKIQEKELVINFVNEIELVSLKPAKNYRIINIMLPSRILSNLTLTTTNSDIVLSNIAVDEAKLSNNGGNINFNQLKINKSTSLSAKNGNIKGTLVGSYDDFSISCTIKKGDTNLPLNKPNGNKSLVAYCNNGDIEINFAP